MSKETTQPAHKTVKKGKCVLCLRKRNFPPEDFSQHYKKRKKY